MTKKAKFTRLKPHTLEKFFPIFCYDFSGFKGSMIYFDKNPRA
jgi:hypothetical protein